MISLLVACPTPTPPPEPHIDYPDVNEDKVDDTSQILTPANRSELFAILDYQKKHEDKGWMAKSIDVSQVKLHPTVLYDEEGYVEDVIDLLFEGREDFNQDISNWNISKVTDMSGMFAGATSFNQDISNWDVSNVSNMMGMFDLATSFNQDISNWDVSKVSDMSFMFNHAESFNQNLSGWDITNTNSDFMFSGTGMVNKGEWHPKGCRCGSEGCAAYNGYELDEDGNIIE